MHVLPPTSDDGEEFAGNDLGEQEDSQTSTAPNSADLPVASRLQPGGEDERRENTGDIRSTGSSTDRHQAARRDAPNAIDETAATLAPPTEDDGAAEQRKRGEEGKREVIGRSTGRRDRL